MGELKAKILAWGRLRCDIGFIGVNECVESFAKTDASIVGKDKVMRLETPSTKPKMFNLRFVRTNSNHSDDTSLTEMMQLLAAGRIEAPVDHVCFDASLQAGVGTVPGRPLLRKPGPPFPKKEEIGATGRRLLSAYLAVCGSKRIGKSVLVVIIAAIETGEVFFDNHLK